MDEVLVHLALAAREQQQQHQSELLSNGNGSGNTVATSSPPLSSSSDGLTIIQDDIYATSLLQYLKMLDLSVGGDYLVQLFDWCNAINSLITIFNEASMSREDKKPKWKDK